MPNIPVELTEAARLASGLTLLVGHGLERPNMVVEVREELLRRMGREDAGQSLPHLAEMYTASASTHALVDVVGRTLGLSTATPELAALTHVPWDTYLTVTPSDALERLFATQGRQHYRPVSSIEDASFASRVHGEPWLVHLFGEVKHPGSVRLTETDVGSFAGPDSLVQYIKDLLVSTTVLICGFAPDDPYLALVHHVRNTFPKPRPAYVIWPDGLDDDGGVWRGRGVYTVSAPVDEVCQAIRTAKDGRTLRARPPMQHDSGDTGSPFKFLDYYTEHDFERFFGRDAQSHALATTIEASRLTLVIGASGSGKTSLVNAGVVPLLHQQGFDTYSVRLIEDPQDEVVSAVTAAGSGDEDGSIDTDLLNQLESLLRGLRGVIVIDQFEELFLRVGEETQKWFCTQLARCIESDDLDVRMVLVLREEFLHRVLDPRLSLGVAPRQHWVKPLSTTDAIAALTRTAELAGVVIEPDLPEQVVSDLKSDAGVVEPAQLQVVAHELYLRSAEPKSLTVTAYHELGKSAGILGSYLSRCIDTLPEGQRKLARQVLMALISPEATKTVVRREELLSDPLLRLVEASEADIVSALKSLIDQRIVRIVPEHPEVYELAHDTMAKQIFEWLSPLDIQITYARQLLRQALVDWQRLGTMPTIERWSEIDARLPALRLDQHAAIFGLTTASHHGTPIEPWRQAAEGLGADTDAVLKDILRTGAPTAQHNVVVELAHHSSEEWAQRLLCDVMESEYVAVRRQAARILEAVPDPRAMKLVERERQRPIFVEVPGGEFPFGTNDPEFGPSGPEVIVHVPSFRIQRYPVTNAEYAEYVADTGARPPGHWPQGSPPDDLLDHPVVSISWHEAVDYCNWYGQGRGMPTRLPTGAEWEKAATWDHVNRRKTAWSWGDTFERSPEKGNSRTGGPGKTTPIGQYSPVGGDAPCGAVDMCGNTFDWVLDWSAPSHDPNDTTDPTGPSSGTHKCARGGSWAGSAEGTSGVSNKYSLTPETTNEYTGFRMAIRDEPRKSGELEMVTVDSELHITLREERIRALARDIGGLTLATDFAAHMTPVNSMEDEPNLRAYLAAAAICHNTKGGLHGLIHGQPFNGWDFLLRSMVSAAEIQGTFPWEQLPVLTGASLTALLASGATQTEITLPDMDRRAEILQELYVDLDESYAGSVTELLRATGGLLRGQGGAYERLERLIAFRDPLKKKSSAFLMAVHFSQRYQFADADEALPMIDYHRMRLLLRTGCIEVQNDDVRAALTAGSIVDAPVEESIRLAAMDVCERVPRLAGMPMFDFDVLLWAHARSCCRHEPLCISRTMENPSFSAYLRDGAGPTCVFEAWCPGAGDANYRSLWEPLVDTEDY